MAKHPVSQLICSALRHFCTCVKWMDWQASKDLTFSNSLQLLSLFFWQKRQRDQSTGTTLDLEDLDAETSVSLSQSTIVCTPWVDAEDVDFTKRRFRLLVYDWWRLPYRAIGLASLTYAQYLMKDVQIQHPVAGCKPAWKFLFHSLKLVVVFLYYWLTGKSNIYSRWQFSLVVSMVKVEAVHLKYRTVRKLSFTVTETKI